MFEIAAPEQTCDASCSIFTGADQCQRIVLGVAHRVVSRNDARRGHRTAELNCALIVGRRALRFFNRIHDWRTRRPLPHQLLVRARWLTAISRAQEQKQDSKRGVKVAT
jgi:hypothetical protein